MRIVFGLLNDDTHAALAHTVDGLALDNVSEARRWLTVESQSLLTLADQAPASTDAADMCMAAGHAFLRLDPVYRNLRTARALFLSAGAIFNSIQYPRGAEGVVVALKALTSSYEVAAHHAGSIDAAMTVYAHDWVSATDFNDLLDRLPGAREVWNATGKADEVDPD